MKKKQTEEWRREGEGAGKVQKREGKVQKREGKVQKREGKVQKRCRRGAEEVQKRCRKDAEKNGGDRVGPVIVKTAADHE